MPLIIALVAGWINHYLHGSAHDYMQSVAYVALTVWAYEEVVTGSSWFRRLLGVVFLIIMVMRMAHLLHT